MPPRSRVPLALGGLVAAILIVFAGGYGYHRDELYFLEAGHHLDWSYADQGPVTPLVARLMSDIAPHSLTVLRIPSALATGLVVLLTGVLARELGGSKRAQALAAACTAVAGVVVFTGHLLSTATLDLLVWTAVTWLVVRAIRTGDNRLWPLAGLILGVGLLNKPLPAFLAVGLLVGVLVAGPRRLVRNPWVWLGAGIAFVLWLPWILWQADHGWPQIDVSRSIASGGSKSSQPWWSIVPFQVLLVGPLLAPVWIAGLVRLVRDPAVRAFRFFAWAWVFLAVVFMASGGKPYYLAGFFPVLLGAGAAPVDRWLDRGASSVRKALLAAALVLSAVVTALIALPILPADSTKVVVALNGDVGETIGWPALARTVARVRAPTPHAVVFTSNYGEAGALDRYGIGPAYSGHNAFGDWGPPPDGAAPVIGVGLDPVELAQFRDCRVVARIDNGNDVDNDEQDEPVSVCAGPRGAWSAIWPSLRHLG